MTRKVFEKILLPAATTDRIDAVAALLGRHPRRVADEIIEVALDRLTTDDEYRKSFLEGIAAREEARGRRSA